MFSAKDKKQIESRGSELNTVIGQIEKFKSGFPYLQIIDAATVGNGIIRLNESDLRKSRDFIRRKGCERNQAFEVCSRVWERQAACLKTFTKHSNFSANQLLTKKF
jgi:hypothetical protein